MAQAIHGPTGDGQDSRFNSRESQLGWVSVNDVKGQSPRVSEELGLHPKKKKKKVLTFFTLI